MTAEEEASAKRTVAITTVMAFAIVGATLYYVVFKRGMS